MFESKKCKMLFKVTVHVNALIYHNRQFVENGASMFKKAICKKELVKQYQTKKKREINQTITKTTMTNNQIHAR